MIRLTEAVLSRFGKFRNKSITFDNGFQVIYGENEAGKSTIQLFIRAMLYGMPVQRKTAGVIRDRDRAIPWGDKNAEGVLRLKEDGRGIEIHRIFGKTAAGDKVEVLDANTGEIIEKYSVDKPGEIFFGISENIFEKAFWIRQQGGFPVGADEEVSKRLMNLLETGDDEISAEKTLAELEREKKALCARDKRGVPGKLDILREAKEKKTEEKYRLSTIIRQRDADINKLREAKKKLKDTDDALEKLREEEQTQIKLRKSEDRLKKWKQVQKMLKTADEIDLRKEYKQFADLTESDLKEAENLKRITETLDQNELMSYDKSGTEDKKALAEKKTKVYLWLSIAGSILVFLSVVTGFLLPIYLPLTGICAGGAVMVYGIMLRLKALSELNFFNAEMERIKIRAEENQNLVQKAEESLRIILDKYQCESYMELVQGYELYQKAKTEKEGLKLAYDALMEDEDYETLRQEAEEAEKMDLDRERIDISEETERLRKMQIDVQSEINRLNEGQGYVLSELKNPADIEAEILIIEKDIREAEEKFKAVEMAADIFDRVYEKRRSDFTPMVNERVNEFLDILTLGRYKDSRVSEEYRLKVAYDGAAVAESEYFSCGTYEQIYLALRIALGELVGYGEEPIFLDDFLAFYDDERAKAALSLLKKLSGERQIVVFTCHKRDIENAEHMDVVIQRLEEE